MIDNCKNPGSRALKAEKANIQGIGLDRFPNLSSDPYPTATDTHPFTPHHGSDPGDLAVIILPLLVTQGGSSFPDQVLLNRTTITPILLKVINVGFFVNGVNKWGSIVGTYIDSKLVSAASNSGATV